MARRLTPSISFNHALTRDVAYASLLKSRRQICHRRVATALEAHDDGSVRTTEPELLAYHFQEAGDFTAAFAYWIAAGDVAEQHGANQEAVAHYRSAKQLAEQADLSTADRARIPEVLMKLGNAQMQMAGYHSEDALQWSTGKRATPRWHRTCRTRPRKPVSACRRSCLEAVAIAMSSQSATASCRGNPDRLRPETLVHVWVMMASASSHIGEFQQSLAFSERAIELDDVVNCTHKAPWAAADPAIVARDYVEMASRLMGDFDRSLAVSEQSMAIAQDRGHLFSVVWASVSRISALRIFGRYAEAVACADHAIEICERV